MARAALALPERGRVECFAGSAVGGAVSASTETGGEGEPVVVAVARGAAGGVVAVSVGTGTVGALWGAVDVARGSELATAPWCRMKNAATAISVAAAPAKTTHTAFFEDLVWVVPHADPVAAPTLPAPSTSMELDEMPAALSTFETRSALRAA